jgi:hypothetical protein
MQQILRKQTFTLLFAAGCALALTLFSAEDSLAQVVPVPTLPKVGSSNPVSAVPPITRPTTTPCTVTLFSNLEFANYTPKTFAYTPPSSCPGPWAKVVFEANFTVTAGVQYDRTAAFYLGHANIFYGTTSEPGSNLSPSWHVERDVTDLTSIFESSQTGEANIGNTVNSTYTGIIYSTATLQFYPVANGGTAPTTPDVVVPVNGGGGDAGTLNQTSDEITANFTPPTNVEAIYLDVLAQSQSNDEFWYSCVPNDVAGELESCGNTGFRETQVYIDGQLAGIAPVTPWIFTGGIDPYLWIPITGAQTLNFEPYRVNLTPFAGTLNDGNEHQVAISVYNADSYFLATANLLLYLDHGSSQVTGSLISNTLTSPDPTVNEDLNVDQYGDVTGSVDVTSGHNFTISGSVATSHGTVTTTVSQVVSFNNYQTFLIDSLNYDQDIAQTSSVESTVTTQNGNNTNVLEKSHVRNLNLDIVETAYNNGSFDQATTSQQQFSNSTISMTNNELVDNKRDGLTVNSTDTLEFNSNGNFTGFENNHSSSSYSIDGTTIPCYSDSLTAENLVLTSFTVRTGRTCQ